MHYVHLLILSQLHIENVVFKVELSEWSMLDIIPQNQFVCRIAGVLTCSYKADDISPKQHLGKLDSSVEVYIKIKMKGLKPIVNLSNFLMGYEKYTNSHRIDD